MKIVRFVFEGGEGARIGITTEEAKRPEAVIDFSAAYQAYRLVEDGCQEPLCTSLLPLLDQGLFTCENFGRILQFVEKHGLVERFCVERPRLLAPIERPPKIMALGRNYLAHARESGHEAPPEPIVFEKANSSVIGPGEPVVIKRWLGRVDHEVELAVVIGRRGSEIEENKALGYVAGYTIVNDVSARDMQAKDLADSNPWWRSKSIDTFCPMGPCIALAESIGEPIELDLELRVNGEVRQKSNTRDLVFKVPALIAHISRFVTLEPGDIISTGTPSGISAIKPGDVMEAMVEKVGILENPVVAG
jgi:2-keto-4-pentenoate hydratase/2-oxohepta-3-ene-1,7-dioic acid hydratase in catechol pathway